MKTFTCSIHYDLMKSLCEKDALLNISKGDMVKDALKIYLDELNKTEYIKSYTNYD